MNALFTPITTGGYDAASGAYALLGRRERVHGLPDAPG
jgi:hypothetical protein